MRVEREKIYREDVLNAPIVFHTKSEYEMNIVRYVLDEFFKYVRSLPAAEEEKKPTRRKRK